MSSLAGNKFLHIFTLILVVQAVLFYSASRGEAAHPAAPLIAFPNVLGPWHEVKEGIIEKEELDVLKADDVLTRVYGHPGGEASLFIAYFKTQRTGQSPHSPKNCLPGSGWQQMESGRVEVDTPAGRIHINRYLVAKGQNESLVYYWYQTQGRVIADEFAAKFYLVEDSIRKHRSDTSLVRIVVDYNPNNVAASEKNGLDFVKTIYPEVRIFLPQ